MFTCETEIPLAITYFLYVFIRVLVLKQEMQKDNSVVDHENGGLFI